MTGHEDGSLSPAETAASCGGPPLCPVCAAELGWPRPCQVTCDPDCEVGPVHCWNWHEPSYKPGWHDPGACDQASQQAASTTGKG